MKAIEQLIVQPKLKLLPELTDYEGKQPATNGAKQRATMARPPMFNAYVKIFNRYVA